MPIDRALGAFARRQPGCRALTRQLYGVGAVTATAILAELGDARRFRSSDDVVRYCGLDVTVWQSDRKRAAVAKRIDHNRACLSVARKLCRRVHHLLRELGDDALAPAEPPRAKLVDAAA